MALPSAMPAGVADQLRQIERWNRAEMEVTGLAGDCRLRAAGNSRFQHFVAAFERGDLLHPHDADPREAIDFYRQHFDRPFQVVVVEHDWARAFGAAIDSGEIAGDHDYRLPFPQTLFEFNVSGRRVCVAVCENEQDPNRHTVVAVIETSAGWFFLPLIERRFDRLRALISSQVRAACIALESVAETERRAPPANLNAARRRRGAPPLFDYHIVKLAHRRYASGRTNGEGTHRRSPRLHFRRGHWRRLGDDRVWIEWTLVGNPDLGFIYKEYRI